jgi:hypothetical protein
MKTVRSEQRDPAIEGAPRLAFRHGAPALRMTSSAENREDRMVYELTMHLRAR